MTGVMTDCWWYVFLSCFLHQPNWVKEKIILTISNDQVSRRGFHVGSDMFEFLVYKYTKMLPTLVGDTSVFKFTA